MLHDDNDAETTIMIYEKIEHLNNQIDEYNRLLTATGDTKNQLHLITEIKALHKEVNRLNIRVLPNAYKGGNH